MTGIHSEDEASAASIALVTALVGLNVRLAELLEGVQTLNSAGKTAVISGLQGLDEQSAKLRQTVLALSGMFDVPDVEAESVLTPEEIQALQGADPEELGDSAEAVKPSFDFSVTSKPSGDFDVKKS